MVQVTRSESARAQHAAVVTVRHHLYGFMATPVLYAAVILDLPDYLAMTPATIPAIADHLAIDTQRVQALLGGLAALEVVERDADQRYHLTVLGELLRPASPGSLTDEIVFAGQAMYPAFGALAGALLTDAVPFDVAFGRDFSAYLARHPVIARAFGRYISSVTSDLVPEILATYDFSPYTGITDVGGGIGTLAAAITQRYPHLQATVLDQAVLQLEAEQYLVDQGVTARCHFVAGDFYTAIPTSDLVVLCQVLHDLRDSRCHEVLQRCHECLVPNGRLLILEMFLDQDTPVLPLVWRDLKMMVMANGAERSHAEWMALLRGANFTVTRVLPMTASARIGDRLPQLYGIEVCRVADIGVAR